MNEQALLAMTVRKLLRRERELGDVAPGRLWLDKEWVDLQGDAQRLIQKLNEVDDWTRKHVERHRAFQPREHNDQTRAG